jgi:hypothetical protein
MDRLARNLDDLRRIVQILTGKGGVQIEFVKEHLTFTGEDSPMAKLMLSVMGAIHEFDRALIKERQGLDHRVGHFRPPRAIAEVVGHSISLVLKRFSLGKRLIGWPIL